MFQLSLALQTIIFVSMDIQQILQSVRVHQFDLVLRENCVFGCDDLQGVFPRVKWARFVQSTNKQSQDMISSNARTA
jgi:hypothetical protein